MVSRKCTDLNMRFVQLINKRLLINKRKLNFVTHLPSKVKQIAKNTISCNRNMLSLSIIATQTFSLLVIII